MDVGQEDDFSAIEEKAYKAGAKQHFYVDAKREFAERYIAKAIVMNGMYEGLYPLGLSLIHISEPTRPY